MAFRLIKQILTTASLQALIIYVQGQQEKQPHLLGCCTEREGDDSSKMHLQLLIPATTPQKCHEIPLD